ncbi:MAG: hypothetical protein ABW168_27690 [Sedimenticola sp.]
MAEFKGGAVLNNKRDSSLMKLYANDITKLGKWRRVVGRQNNVQDPNLRPIDFIFVVVDLRNRHLDPDLHDELSSQAKREGVRFVYLHLPKVERNTNHAA